MMRWPEAVTSRLDQMGNVDIRDYSLYGLYTDMKKQCGQTLICHRLHMIRTHVNEWHGGQH